MKRKGGKARRSLYTVRLGGKKSSGSPGQREEILSIITEAIEKENDGLSRERPLIHDGGVSITAITGRERRGLGGRTVMFPLRGGLALGRPKKNGCFGWRTTWGGRGKKGGKTSISPKTSRGPCREEKKEHHSPYLMPGEGIERRGNLSRRCEGEVVFTPLGTAIEKYQHYHNPEKEEDYHWPTPKKKTCINSSEKKTRPETARKLIYIQGKQEKSEERGRKPSNTTVPESSPKSPQVVV